MIFTGCSKDLEITDTENFDFSFEKPFVQPGEKSVLSITADNKALLSKRMHLIWQTDNGQIVIDNGTTIFIAPDSPCTARITLIITDSAAFEVRTSHIIGVYSQVVILKADDLQFDEENILSKNWQRYIQLIDGYNIKSALGVIGNSLEKGNSIYHTTLSGLHNSMKFELFNHGYNHLLNERDTNGNIYCEFKNRSVQNQIENLNKTQRLAKEKLGIYIHAFGAPGNAIDKSTSIALKNQKDITIWLYGNPNSGLFVLPRKVEAEFPVCKPDYIKFLENYQPYEECLTIQLHPNRWDEQDLKEFENIVRFLITKKVLFLTPSDYHGLKSES